MCLLTHITYSEGYQALFFGLIRIGGDVLLPCTEVETKNTPSRMIPVVTAVHYGQDIIC